MGIASSGLDLIRRVFQRDLANPRGAGAPFSPYVQDINFATHQNSMVGQAGMALSSTYDGVRDQLTIEQDYATRLEDYAEMDDYPEISATLDLAADDATIQSVIDGRILWYEAPDEVVSEVLNEMLVKQIRVNEDIWGLTRNVCKYGNAFSEIIARDKMGVLEMRELPADQMRRIQDRNGILYGFLYDMNKAFGASTAQFGQLLNMRGESPAGQGFGYVGHSNELMVQAFEPWEMVHFRMMGGTVGDPYGKALTDSARYIWRRLQMMEDSMLVYKLSRSAQRYAFYVDVGDVPPREARKLLSQVRDDLKKKKYVDSAGKLQLRYDVLSPDEDFFMATRKGSRATEVEVLSAPEGQQVDDVNYFREKLFAALKVPKSYLGGDDTVGRANLSQLDVRWARTVMRVQNVMKQGYGQVARVELACRNIDPDRVEFVPMMNVPSGVLEMAQLEVQNAKLDLATRYQQANFSEYWIWSNVLSMSDDDIEAIQKQRVVEQGGGVTEARQVIDRDINKAKDRDKRNGLDSLKNQVLDEVAAGRSDFAKRAKELKLLINDLRGAMGRVERRQKKA